MLNNNHKDQCVWTDQLVEFIYDEMDEAQKNNFTAHLPDCVACREEISAFGGVRNTLAAYWQDEFAPLNTPPIEIPQQTTTVRTLAAPARSWLDSLRALFAGSLTWMPTAAMAAAALVLCGFLAFVFLSGTQNTPEIVQENNPNTVNKPTETPTPQTVPTPEVAQQTENQSGGTTTPEKAKQNPQKTVTTVNKNQPIKVSTEKNTPVENKRGPEKVKEKVQPRNNPKKTQKKESEMDLPDLDEEDDSLRLADMFEEIDSEE
jgi:hypothetical protein